MAPIAAFAPSGSLPLGGPAFRHSSIRAPLGGSLGAGLAGGRTVRAATSHSALSTRMAASEGEGAPLLSQWGTRRAALFSILASTLLMGGSPGGAATDEATQAAAGTLSSRVMQVVPTSVPEQPYGLTEASAGGESALIKSFAELDALFLGEHHNSFADHALQAEIIQTLHKETKTTGKKVEVGLEMVQKQFQPVLDAYISRANKDDKQAEKELYDGVRWAERWFWSYEAYLPVFRSCRELGIPLVALNVDSETLTKVSAGGLDALSQAEKDAYVSDKKGFVSFIKTPGYSQYVNEVCAVCARACVCARATPSAAMRRVLCACAGLE
mmetsp:Transcript_39408/g.96957  ORF Transcript_39408/g.96957 Transcript_39408/m.96957 type:complete len:327 (+) Transcript_39408:43-1023(+)